jgi:uncharacterized phage-like protein YoqJ
MSSTYHVAFSGHRPEKIGGYNRNAPLRQAVAAAIRDELKIIVNAHQNQEIVVVTGGALGVDTDAAREAFDLGLKYIVAVPFRGQEKGWPDESKRQYKNMLELASKVEYVHDGPYTHGGLYQDRNIWMVDNSDILIALWDGSSGGTANCVAYAQKKKHELKIINPNDLK